MTHLSPTQLRDVGQRAMQLTARLLEQHPIRPAGTDSSRGAADSLGADALGFTQQVQTEDFPVHPRAFLAWIRFLLIMYALGVVCLYLRLPALALASALVGIAVMVGQFLFYAEVLDRFFPKLTGRNVWATVEPKGEVRGQLIISGHHDSARITNLLAKNPEKYTMRMNLGMGAYLLFTVLALALTFFPGASLWAAVLLTLLLPLLLPLWNFAADEYTPGAGDNLASSAAAWEAVRFLAEQGQMEHLRVVAASWDAEECGLRGARAWLKNRHGDGRVALPTWNLNIECLYDENELFLLTTDVNGTVKLDADLARTCQSLIAEAGAKADVRPLVVMTGGTDAGEFGRIGIPTTTLFGMPFGNDNRSPAYHTPRDTLDAVSEQAVARTVELGVNLAHKLDADLSKV